MAYFENKETENIPIILLGNKCDLIDIDTDALSKQAQSIANDHFKCTYVETSAKNDINVSKAFQAVVELILKKIDEQNALNAANVSRRSSTVSFMRRISISLPAKTDRRYSDTVVTEIKNQNCSQNKSNTNANNHKKDSHKKHCIIS
jgi:hypothetical protein